MTLFIRKHFNDCQFMHRHIHNVHWVNSIFTEVFNDGEKMFGHSNAWRLTKREHTKNGVKLNEIARVTFNMDMSEHFFNDFSISNFWLSRQFAARRTKTYDRTIITVSSSSSFFFFTFNISFNKIRLYVYFLCAVWTSVVIFFMDSIFFYCCRLYYWNALFLFIVLKPQS